ncbi:MAG: single-stranded-DNA-specific exonuclease RecJ [Alkaliphilus sp.]
MGNKLVREKNMSKAAQAVLGFLTSKDGGECMEKTWVYNIANREKTNVLQEKLKVSPIISKILVNREIDEPSNAKKFLDSSLSDLHDPFLLKGMRKAVNRIVEAIENDESIWIYGDYDVDGISSTSILLKYFTSINYEVNFYIPDRLEEGYGLKCESIEKINRQGADLIITVDCGITAYEEVEYANKLEVDIIITDHHECQENLPKAVAIINPKQNDCSYPFKHLCGCGIALKLIQALTPREIFKINIYDYIDLAAMATVADIVSLVDENRIFVKHGLNHFKNSENKGVRELLNVCGLKNEKITAGRIGFTIAPRINAAGRIKNASMAVRLLTTENLEEARELAQILDEENKKRQIIEAKIYEEAVYMIESSPKLKKDAFLVVYKEGWHPGVVGIVASRIAEKYYKPTIILGTEIGIAKGSARSIAGFNLFSTMSECKELFEKFGGHEQAAGLTLKLANIEIFTNKINEIAADIIKTKKLTPEIKFDAILNMADISDELVSELEQLEPFGIGNPAPKFMYRTISVDGVYCVGKDNKHIKLGIVDNKKYIGGIGFGLGEKMHIVKEAKTIDLLFTPSFNEYNGRRKIQLIIKDIKDTNYEATQQTTFDKKYYSTMLLKSSNNQIFQFDIEKIKWYLDDTKDEELFAQLEANPGSIIIVNTLEKAKYLLSLTNVKLKRKEVSYKFNFNNIDNKLNNSEIHIVINPNIAKIDFNSYNRVMLFDLFFSIEDYNALLARVESSKIVGFYKKGDMIFNSSVLENIIPKRKELVAIYKYLKENISETTYTLDRITNDMNNRHGNLFNSKIITHALELFRDGNLVEYRHYNQVISLEILNVNQKIDLLHLSKYAELLNYSENFNKVKNKLSLGGIL